MDIEEVRSSPRKSHESPKYNVLDKISPVRWYTNTIVRFPKATFCCTIAIPIILLVLLVIALASGVFYLSPDVLLEDRDDRSYVSEAGLKIARRDTTNEVYKTILKISPNTYTKSCNSLQMN